MSAFILFAIIILTLIFLYGAKALTIASLKLAETDGSLYTMRFYGDYGFDELLKKGVNNNDELEAFIRKKMLIGNLLKERNFKRPQCTSFSAVKENGGYLFGRNLDSTEDPTLLLYTAPKGGYASISLVDIYYLGYDSETWGRQGLVNKALLLAAPYFPSDGMNECGLAVSSLAVDNMGSKNDPEKKTIAYQNALRMVLDHARDVNEAIELLKSCNIFMNDTPAHIFLADATGRSAVVEYLDDDVYSTGKTEKWQVVTNFQVCGWNGIEPEDADASGDSSMYRRYSKADSLLAEKSGVIDSDYAMEILEKVSQEDTVYSAVYDLTERRLELSVDGKYDSPLSFSLFK
ncbi:MAG: linear amide C-N hydrolase [Clostridiales bacterium]|nr:linear amide C-N hydrolase [Clostridiales bacterium]